MLVDSHVNLHAPQFEGEVDHVINRARVAGISTMLTISDRLENIEKIMAISEANSDIWHSVGVHPHYAEEAEGLEPSTLIDLAAHPRAIGIGECGLDYYYEHSNRQAQKPVFEAHIKAAQETDLPLIIHNREADDDMSELLLASHKEKPFTPLMHCYTSGMALAKTALELGGMIAFSGITTFKKAEEVRDVARFVPMDRLIIETDCPYLAPIPKRGRRNEPSYLPHIASFMADLKNLSEEDFARQTSDNFFRLFAKAERP